MSEDRTPEQSEADDVPMNRAERRAKGKKGAQQPHFTGKKKVQPKGDQGAHAPRLWANRRAG